MMRWKKINRVVKDLWLGTALFFLLYEGIGLIFAEYKLDYTIGLLIGSITTCYLVYHMYESLDVGLSMDEKSAAKYLRNKSIVRWIIRVAVAIASVYIPHVSVVGVMIGLLGLKLSAYFQPVIHKFWSKVER